MTENTHSSTIAEVTTLDEQFSDAATQVDTAALERIMSDDYLFIGAEGQMKTREGHIASLKPGGRKYTSLKTDEVKVRPYGDVAVMTGRVMAEGSLDGKDMSGCYLVTRVYVKQDERWRIVSAQATLSP